MFAADPENADFENLSGSSYSSISLLLGSSGFLYGVNLSSGAFISAALH